jgi:hypothetical protein
MRGVEVLRRIDADHAHAEVACEHLHDAIALLVAQQAVVDEHAGALLADRLVQECRDHRGIHTAGEAEQHVAGADLGSARTADPAQEARPLRPHCSIRMRSRP